MLLVHNLDLSLQTGILAASLVLILGPAASLSTKPTRSMPKRKLVRWAKHYCHDSGSGSCAK